MRNIISHCISPYKIERDDKAYCHKIKNSHALQPSKKLLEVFGLNTLKDLPKIEELKKPS